MDTLLLFHINKQWINPVLDRLMAICSDFDLWRPVLFIVVLFLFWRGGFRWRSFLIVTLITIAFTDGVFTQATKILVNRPRPIQALADVREVTLQKTHPAFLGLFQPIECSTITYSGRPGHDRTFIPIWSCDEQHGHRNIGHPFLSLVGCPVYYSGRIDLVLTHLLWFALAD